jgi:hypothetical protein
MSQGQGTNHLAASNAAVLTVGRASPVYGDFVIPTKTYGAADFLLTLPSTTSTGAFTFSSSDPSKATVNSDGLITVVAPGPTEITAYQAQTPTHIASSIVTTFVVTKATPTLSGFDGESAGLSGRRYVNYYNDDPNWFTTATLHGDTATSTQIQGFSSNDEFYSWQWLGTFRSAAAGTYNFCTSSDDASHLWIGASATSGFTTSNATVNNGGLHPVQTQCGNVTLAATTNYPIRIQFGEYTGSDAISVYFTPPGGTATYDGTGYFFSGGGLTKTLGDQPFTPSIPTSVSPGDITYTSSDTSVATIHPTSGEITVLSDGTTTITATQAATSNYNSSTVTTTLTVLPAGGQQISTFRTPGYVAPVAPQTPTENTTTLPEMYDAATQIQTPFDIKLGNTLYEGQGTTSQIYVTSKATITFGTGDYIWTDFPSGPSISVFASDFQSAGPNAGITVTTTETTLDIVWNLHKFGVPTSPITTVTWTMTVNPVSGEWTGVGTVAGNTTDLWYPLRTGVRLVTGESVQPM